MLAPREFDTVVWMGEALEKRHFPAQHPNAINRQAAFWAEAQRLGLHERVRLGAPRLATPEELLRFHSASHVNWVRLCSQQGSGFIDDADTPAYPGVYEDAANRVGTALEALSLLMAGTVRRSFQPVGGMHHARRERGAGFCPLSDIGVVIESLRAQHGIRRIAYVDIDAHHGDGVFYSYERDPDLVVVDIHQDGRTLFPGSGHAEETGKDGAAGTKLNLTLPPGSGDPEFFAAWEQAEAHLERLQPEFFILQCGADSLAGDPLADLRLTPAAHAYAARRLVAQAERHARGRLMAMGGGGYRAENVAAAWAGVLQELVLAESGSSGREP
jgi:acetoin utilization protein AcuC